MSLRAALRTWWAGDHRPVDRVDPVLIPRADSLENPSVTLSQWLTQGTKSGAGYAVTDQSAMRVSTVYACTALLAGIVAALPFKVYRKTSDGREAMPDAPAYRLIHDEPNRNMTAFIWRELMMVDLLLGGNHYAFIETDDFGYATGLVPMDRNSVEPIRAPSGELSYRVRTTEGWQTIASDYVLHIPGMGFDGYCGLSVIKWAARNPIGISMALEDATGAFSRNAVRPSGIVEIPSSVNAEGLKRIRAQFKDAYAGIENSGGLIILDAGSKWSQATTISAEDAQTLEQRRFQVSDIARAFGVPPVLIGETDKTTSWGTGVEQIVLGFLRFGLERWLKRIEDEVQRKLLFGRKYLNHYCEFDRDALLAMDAKSRSEFLSSSIQSGLMTPNEGRRVLNLPNKEGGDELFIQANLQTVRNAINGAAGVQPSQP